jgi:hypothetical protein
MENMPLHTGTSPAIGATEELIGERRLWTAVLLQALDDWRLGTLRKRREAQRFLFDDHANLGIVCAGAGLDPGSFCSKLLKIGSKVDMESYRPPPLPA